MKAVSSSAGVGALWRITPSSMPIQENASMETEKLEASAIRPKSAGASRRTRTSVLIRPSARVAMRQATTQPAPRAVFARMDALSSLIPALHRRSNCLAEPPAPG